MSLAEAYGSEMVGSGANAGAYGQHAAIGRDPARGTPCGQATPLQLAMKSSTLKIGGHLLKP